MNGNDVNLSTYGGKVLLIVNVASKWYDLLQNLDSYHRLFPYWNLPSLMHNFVDLGPAWMHILSKELLLLSFHTQNSPLNSQFYIYIFFESTVISIYRDDICILRCLSVKLDFNIPFHVTNLEILIRCWWCLFLPCAPGSVLLLSNLFNVVKMRVIRNPLYRKSGKWWNQSLLFH